MQTIKEKLNDMSVMRKAKAEAREEEKAEQEYAKARLEHAHEVRKAKEAEAVMDLHVNKAAEKVAHQDGKHSHSHSHLHSHHHQTDQLYDGGSGDLYSHNPSHSTNQTYGGGAQPYSGSTQSYGGGMQDPYAYNASNRGSTTTAENFIHDHTSAMNKAKAEAQEEELEEKEVAKSRIEVAHEVRMARQAEAEMDLHVKKAAEKVNHHEANHSHHH